MVATARYDCLLCKSEFIELFMKGLVLIALSGIVIGSSMIASGQVFLAIREIALNTRKEGSGSISQYNMLLTIVKINNFLGWLLFLLGVLGVLASLVFVLKTRS